MCSPQDVVRALDAALEVNEHLSKEVESKGNEVQDLRLRLSTCERRLQLLSDKLKASKLVADPHVEEHVSVVVRSRDRACRLPCCTDPLVPAASTEFVVQFECSQYTVAHG